MSFSFNINDKTLQRAYTAELKTYTSSLREQDKRHKKESGSTKYSDLDMFRRGLEDLTSKLDEVDQFKHDHYETVAEHTRNVWSGVIKRATLAARAQVDIWEKISDRGLQNDCLGRMVASAGDPFTATPEAIIRQIEKRIEVFEMYPRLISVLILDLSFLRRSSVLQVGMMKMRKMQGGRRLRLQPGNRMHVRFWTTEHQYVRTIVRLPL
jgi:hypothetical protein